MPITEEGVDTEAFLEASDGLVQMFGEQLAGSHRIEMLTRAMSSELLGSAIFGFVQNDMRQNLAVIMTLHEVISMD